MAKIESFHKEILRQLGFDNVAPNEGDVFFNLRTNSFLVPIISISSLVDSYSNGSYSYSIVEANVVGIDSISREAVNDFQLLVKKYGVFRRGPLTVEKFFKNDDEEDDEEDGWEKFIDFKYDNIISFGLNADNNVYYVGVIGSDENNKCDFYINHKLIFKEIPYNNGEFVKVLDKGYAIVIKDIRGRNQILRKGKILQSTLYDVKDFCILKYWNPKIQEYSLNEKKYLIVVSKNNSYGLVSPSGRLILPIKYSTIDIDDNMIIVLGTIDNSPESADYYDNWRNNELMQVGKFYLKEDIIISKDAIIEDNKVIINKRRYYCYYWDDGFDVIDESLDNDDNGSYDEYTWEDSLYDALDGHMDAIWNID